MRNYFEISLLLTLLFLTSLLVSQNTQVKFRHNTATDGLPAPSVNSIIKDEQGFIWLATGIGLYRYDGYNFKEYRNNPHDSNSLSSNILNSQLFIDQSGDLWVGTKDRGLNKFNISTETVVRYQNDPLNSKSLSNNNIHKVIQDDEGVIWVATLGGGLNMLDKDGVSFSSFYPEPNDKSDKANFIQSLIEFDTRNLLVGTRKSLYLFNKATKGFQPFYAVYKNEIFKREEVISDIIYDDSLLWISTENGLIKYDIENNTAYRFISNLDDKTSLSSNVIRQIVNTHDNQSLWISTVWGLNHFDKKSKTFERFLYNSDDPNSLGFNMLWGLYLDETNLLWIGTDNAGVNVLNLNTNPFRHIKMESTTHVNKQFSALVFNEDTESNLWVGTFGGGLWQFDKNFKFLKNYQHQNGRSDVLASNNIFSLCFEPEGNLWIGSSNGGVNKFKHGELTRLFIDPANTHKDQTSVIEIAIDLQDVVWFGTLTGLYYFDRSKGKGIKNIDADPLSTALIRSICIDRNNNLWIGAQGEGLFKLNRSDQNKRVLKNYRHMPDDPESINSDNVMSVYEDVFGDIWIASTQGLNKYIPETDRFISYDAKNGLEVDYLYHIQGEESGKLWITSSVGLVCFDPKADSKQRSRLFELNQDVPFEDVYPYSFYIKKNGEICIGGKSGSDYGFYWFHPDSIRDNTKIPRIALTSIKVKNEDLKLDSTVSAKKLLVLHHNQNFITFNFAVLDFTDTKKNQYAYFLEGFEQDWNYVGNRQFANYTGIPPGEYIFKVKGCNNDGYWNETGTRVSVTILPPPWKTWWAYLIYFLIISGLIITVFKFYLRRQKLLHELKLLEKEKRMQAANLLIEGQEKERKRIAKELHDGLGVLLSAAKIQVSTIKQDDSENKSLVKKAISLLDQATGDVRKISHNMMPGLLSKFGIFEAIKDLTDKINEGEELNAHCTVEGPEKRFAENIEIMLYRIIQELIHNTLKHGGASTITIYIRTLPNQLDVNYSDNGNGFDLNAKLDQKSIGLQSILSRLNFLGADLTFESNEGEGSTFYMKIPI